MSAFPPRAILSKSTFVRGCQCVKSLWLYKKHFDLRDKPTARQERMFIQGTDVGILAQSLFGNGVDASPSSVFRFRESVSDTSSYIARGHTVIFEAAFQHNGIMCAVDVLIRHKDKWYVYEVKSSTSVKEQFIQDAALQYHVITGAGLPIEDIFIVHINSSYVRCGDLQLRQLFTKQSVKQQVLEMQPMIAAKADELKLIASQKMMPSINVGAHCTTPYKCDFHSFCWKGEVVVEPDRQSEIMTEMPRIQKQVLPVIYPVYFFQLYTFRVAVPEYDGHWPYRHIPFQFAVKKASADGDSTQYILAVRNAEPCRQIVEQLENIFEKEGVIMVFNKTAIEKRLLELEADYPSYADSLKNIRIRLAEIEVDKHAGISGIVAEENNLAIPFLRDSEEAAAAWYNLKFETNPGKVASTQTQLKAFAEMQFEIMFRLAGEH